MEQLDSANEETDDIIPLRFFFNKEEKITLSYTLLITKDGGGTNSFKKTFATECDHQSAGIISPLTSDNGFELED